MADQKPDETETAVREHVRKILAQIGALQARLRAQEQARESGSGQIVEVEREDDRARLIDNTDLPP